MKGTRPAPTTAKRHTKSDLQTPTKAAKYPQACSSPGPPSIWDGRPRGVAFEQEYRKSGNRFPRTKEIARYPFHEYTILRNIIMQFARPIPSEAALYPVHPDTPLVG